MNEVVIGHICEKGNHLDLAGNSDYGCCGSHYYAEIRISVVETRRNMRGEPTPTAGDVAEEIAEMVRRREELEWRLDGN